MSAMRAKPLCEVPNYLKLPAEKLWRERGYV